VNGGPTFSGACPVQALEGLLQAQEAADDETSVETSVNARARE